MGGRGDQDLWVSRLVHGVYQPLENLGDSINTAGGEIEPWIAPDESYLVFSAGRRPDSLGTYDLYIAERKSGVWQKAHRLPNGINTAAWEFNPSVSPDGRWLYFSSNRPTLARSDGASTGRSTMRTCGASATARRGTCIASR